MAVYPFRSVLLDDVNAGADSLGVKFALVILISTLKNDISHWVVRIAHVLELRETRSANRLFANNSLVVIFEGSRTRVERYAVERLVERILGVANRLRKFTENECTLTYDIHINYIKSLNFLYMSLDPYAVTVASLLRIISITCLDNTNDICPYIITPPIIAFWSLEWDLASSCVGWMAAEFV